MNYISLFLTLFVGMFILLGTIIGLSNKDNKKFSDLTISLAFGVIIALVLLELIPESFEILNEQIGIIRSILAIIILILIGIVLLKILDLFVPCHEHEAHHKHKHENDFCHNEHLYHIGIVSSVALVLHNVIEGMSLYLVASNNLLSGLLLCIGIGFHNIPMGFMVATTLSSNDHFKDKIKKISFLISLSTFVGGVVMFILGGVNEILEGVLLGLTAGMLIYISIFELLHQIYHMENKFLSKIGISFGLLLFSLSMLIEHLVG